MMKKATIIGAGAWGTALALVLCRAGVKVSLYSRNAEAVESINKTRANQRYLPGTSLPEGISASVSLEEVLGTDVLVVTTPSQFLRESCVKLQEAGVPSTVPVLLCCKGIEKGSLHLMSEIVAEILPHNPVAVLSGPNFADEIAMGLPAATTIACENTGIGGQLVRLLGAASFRPYYSNDVIGAQIGVAVKNVLAIGAGILVGRGLGENAKAALITRGLAEMVRLGVAKGGKAETLMGLSGVGDLILTCSSTKSRNMSFGIRLGQGERIESTMLEKPGATTEGVASAASVTALATLLQVEMPICQAVYNVLYQRADIDSTIQHLLERPLTSEVLRSC